MSTTAKLKSPQSSCCEKMHHLSKEVVLWMGRRLQGSGIACWNGFKTLAMTVIARRQYALIKKHYPRTIELIKFNGSTRSYYKKLSTLVNNCENRDEVRIERVLHAVRQISGNLFSKDATELLLKTLSASSLISTAEHHCFLTFDQQLNTAINQACLRSFMRQDACVVFACSTLKLDGHTLPGVISYKSELIPALPNKYRKKMVLQAPSFDLAVIEKSLNKKCKIRGEEAVLESVLKWMASTSQDINQRKLFWEQVSQFNYRFWASIFNPDISFHVPRHYFMLPLEEIVRLTLIEELQADQKGWLMQMILDPQLRRRFHEALDGIEICWDAKLKKGSFIFWRIDAEGRRLQINFKGQDPDLLPTSEEIKMDAHSLVDALKNREIVPTAGFSIIYLSLYCGFDVLGGLFQVNYLPEIQSRLIKNLHNVMSKQDLLKLKNAKTDFFVNFNNTQKAVLGGLTKVHAQISEKELLTLYEENFRTSLKRNIDRLAAQTR